MARSIVQETLAEVELPGILARLAKRHYSPGAQKSCCYPDHVLVYRVGRTKSGIRTSFQQAAPAENAAMFLIPAQVRAVAIAPEVEETSTTVTLQFRPNWMVETVEASEDWIARKPEQWLRYYNWDIEMALRRIATEMAHPNSCSRLIIETCSRMVAADLFQNRPFDDDNAGSHCNALDEQRVEYIKGMILQHPSASPGLTDLAAYLGIGRAHLTNIFKRQTGMTVFAYIQEVRLIKARAMLRDTKASLKQIAYDLGYCSPSAFSNAFHASTGQTPREYRFS